MKLNELMKNFIQDYLDKNKIDFDDWNINPSTQKGFGDYSSNVALKLTKLLKKSPLEIFTSCFSASRLALWAFNLELFSKAFERI